MKSRFAAAQTATWQTETLSCFYTLLRERLILLLPQFGLESSNSTILRAFDVLCSGWSAFQGRNQAFSTLNEDGTPFQFSLQLGPWLPALQFLVEPGNPTLSDLEQVELGWQTIDTLAALVGADRALASCRELLIELATQSRVTLSSNQGTLFWVGMGFRPGESPRLRIYVNSNWGNARGVWWRLDALASFLGAQRQWNSQKALLHRMQPIGLSLTIGKDIPIAGRVYARAYGNPLSYYEELARETAGAAFSELFMKSAQLLLGDGHKSPTKSVVCSFGMGQDGPLADYKCEFCGHCAFPDETEAVARCRRWLSLTKTDLAPYLKMLQELTRNGRLPADRHFHSFVGLGVRDQQPYCTFYLNPGAVR